MADKKEEVPDHISKYLKLTKKAKNMVSTMDRHHRGAYNAAVDAVLTKDGTVDQDLLDDKNVQVKFVDKMVDHYISKAKQQFKIQEGAKFDDLEQTLLMNAYSGTTRDQLLQEVRQHKKGFTFDYFNREVRPEMTKQIYHHLKSAAGSHLKEEHIDDIIRYTKTEGLIDKEKIRLQEAVPLLEIYEEMGMISPKQIKDSIFYKKPKKDK